MIIDAAHVFAYAFNISQRRNIIVTTAIGIKNLQGIRRAFGKRSVNQIAHIEIAVFSPVKIILAQNQLKVIIVSAKINIPCEQVYRKIRSKIALLQTVVPFGAEMD